MLLCQIQGFDPDTGMYPEIYLSRPIPGSEPGTYSIFIHPNLDRNLENLNHETHQAQLTDSYRVSMIHITHGVWTYSVAVTLVP